MQVHNHSRRLLEILLAFFLKPSNQILSPLFVTETNAVWRDSGDNVTLGCSSCDKGYDGMYLYLYREHKPRIQVVYYPESGDETTPGDAFIERIQTNGSLSKHTVTISTLSVNDSGFYKCVYVTFPSGETSCSNYILFVRGKCLSVIFLTNYKSADRVRRVT